MICKLQQVEKQQEYIQSSLLERDKKLRGHKEDLIRIKEDEDKVANETFEVLACWHQ